MARVPYHLTWPEVRAVIDAIDPGDPVGKRDRAHASAGAVIEWPPKCAKKC
jgi:hypothetical protein